MAVVGISRRTTFYREKRAHAYALPLDAIDRRNGGRPPADNASDGSDTTRSDNPTESVGDGQQRLDTVADGSGQEDAVSADVTEQATDESSDEREGRENRVSSEQPAVQGHIQRAIAALQRLDGEL